MINLDKLLAEVRELKRLENEKEYFRGFSAGLEQRLAELRTQLGKAREALKLGVSLPNLCDDSLVELGDSIREALRSIDESGALK